MKKEEKIILVLLIIVVLYAVTQQTNTITGKSTTSQTLGIISPDADAVFNLDTLSPIMLFLTQDTSTIHGITITRNNVNTGEQWVMQVPLQDVIDESTPEGRGIDFFGQYTNNQRKYSSDGTSYEWMEFNEGVYELSAAVTTDLGTYTSMPITFTIAT